MADSGKHHPWYRLHLKTWLLILVLLGIQSAVVIPAHPTVVADSSLERNNQVFHVTYHHGWPWVYFKSIRIEVEPFLTNSVDLSESNSLLDGPLSEVESKNNKQWNQLEKAAEATWSGRNYDVDLTVGWKIPEPVSYTHLTLPTICSV